MEIKRAALFLAGHTFYSYVDPASGGYTKVGLIERVSRFADTPDGTGLFVDETTPEHLDAIIIRAKASALFESVDPALVDSMLRAARRAERVSRHKHNPNCPSVGDRNHLIASAILTNELPRL